MRTIAAVAGTIILLSMSTDAATAAPWCAQYGGRGGTNCGFYSFQQCQATVWGTGGFCTRNQLENPAYYPNTRRYRREYSY